LGGVLILANMANNHFPKAKSRPERVIRYPAPMVPMNGNDQASDETWVWVGRTSGLTQSKRMSTFFRHLKRAPATALSYAAGIAAHMIVNQSMF
jgi:hypothetical protein